MTSNRVTAGFLSLAGVLFLFGSAPGVRAQVSAGRIDPDQLSKFSASSDPKVLAQDRLFISDAYEGGLGEIQLLQLASSQGTDGVKKLAAQLLPQRTSLNDSLKQGGSSLGASIAKKPGKKDMGEYNKLKALSGADFDKEFLAYMEKDHKKELADFQQEAGRTQSPGLLNVVQQGETVITEHLKLIEQTQSAGS